MIDAFKILNMYPMYLVTVIIYKLNTDKNNNKLNTHLNLFEFNIMVELIKVI